MSRRIGGTTLPAIDSTRTLARAAIREAIRDGPV
jgi:hypothetical protein